MVINESKDKLISAIGQDLFDLAWPLDIPKYSKWDRKIAIIHNAALRSATDSDAVEAFLVSKKTTYSDETVVHSYDQKEDKMIWTIANLLSNAVDKFFAKSGYTTLADAFKRTPDVELWRSSYQTFDVPKEEVSIISATASAKFPLIHCTEDDADVMMALVENPRKTFERQVAEKLLSKNIYVMYISALPGRWYDPATDGTVIEPRVDIGFVVIDKMK